MLPAISADLPAYVAPPPRGEPGGRPAAEPGFGPSARVSLSADRAIEAQSQRPGEGIYGPDGRFVETAHRRDIAKERREEPDRRPERQADKSAADRSTRESDESPRTQESDRVPSAESTDDARRTRPTHSEASRDHSSSDSDEQAGETSRRDLSLAEVDAAIPPAEREELRELADRASRDGDKGLTARDYKRLARLMERVGRYPDALRAMDRARELEEALAGEL